MVVGLLAKMALARPTVYPFCEGTGPRKITKTLAQILLTGPVTKRARNPKNGGRFEYSATVENVFTAKQRPGLHVNVFVTSE